MRALVVISALMLCGCVSLTPAAPILPVPSPPQKAWPACVKYTDGPAFADAVAELVKVQPKGYQIIIGRLKDYMNGRTVNPNCKD